MTNIKVSDILDAQPLNDKVSPEEWEARVDLAACYRLAQSHGWNRNIYNHVLASSISNKRHSRAMSKNSKNYRKSGVYIA